VANYFSLLQPAVSGPVRGVVTTSNSDTRIPLPRVRCGTPRATARRRTAPHSPSISTSPASRSSGVSTAADVSAIARGSVAVRASHGDDEKG